MELGRIAGKTRTVGLDQGNLYLPLHLRDEIDPRNGDPIMATALYPSAEDIHRLMNGEPLILKIKGVIWPPVFLCVGDDNAPPSDGTG